MAASPAPRIARTNHKGSYSLVKEYAAKAAMVVLTTTLSHSCQGARLRYSTPSELPVDT
jgi:hypothetical protein